MRNRRRTGARRKAWARGDATRGPAAVRAGMAQDEWDTVAGDSGLGSVPEECQAPHARHGGTGPERIPRWMTELRAGAFDRRVLDQGTYWATREGAVLAISDMSVAHLLNAVQMLQRAAQPLHLEAMVDAILDDGSLEAELITHQLTGVALQDATPEQWLETTPLVRAMRRTLARRGSASAGT